MVTVENISKQFQETKAVREVSFHVKKGEIFGLIGANGSGKTTTLKMIVGLLQPNEGKIRIDGVDRLEDATRARRLVGYAPEAPFLYDYLSGADYLTFVAQVRGLKEAVAEQTAWKLLEFFDLLSSGKELIRNYSYGMKKKISVASALIGEPPVLILDEPTEGLDIFSIRQLNQRLQELKSQGKSILIASHMTAFLTETADRLAILHRGRLAKILELSAFPEEKRLGQVEEIYRELSDEKGERGA